MCSAATLVILDSGKIKIIVATFNNLRREQHQVFMEILANEKPQKSRVTVFFDEKKTALIAKSHHQFAFALTSHRVKEWRKDDIENLSSRNGLKKFTNY